MTARATRSPDSSLLSELRAFPRTATAAMTTTAKVGPATNVFERQLLRPESDLRDLLDPSAPHDNLAPFKQVIFAIRGVAMAISIVLAIPGIAHLRPLTTGWCIILGAYNAFRTSRPVVDRGDTAGVLQVLGEVAISVMAVAATGFWSSPFVFCLITAVAVAGFARGFGFAIRIGMASALAVGIPYLVGSTNVSSDIRASAQWTIELLLVALIAGYTRRIMGEADRQHWMALDRLDRLSDANELLFSLHRVAQSLPSSLDLDEVLDSTMSRLRDLFRFDAAALLLFDETDQRWVVSRAHGTRTDARLSAGELPAVLRDVVAQRGHVVIRDLRGGPGRGLARGMSSGLYAVLEAREGVVGLVAIEFAEADRVTPRDVELLTGLVEPAGLAIDNARWFGRIRTVGADEERTRIARDLHDRIAQSLAYLGFELDRIVAAEAEGEELTEALGRLRSDVRGVVGEVRDTLYDLRTDVTDSQDMTTTLTNFLQRVKDRSDLEVVLQCDETERLPLRQEREMWRIAQEAIANVERHAHATLVTVTWTCDGRSASVEVTDNGIGFPSGRAGRMDSFGVLGMRERAASIGATLHIKGQRNKGTTVQCQLHEV